MNQGGKRIKEEKKARRDGARETGLFQFTLFLQGAKAQINLQLTFQFSCYLEEEMLFWHNSDSGSSPGRFSIQTHCLLT